jgi:PRTRC genetic system protein E
MFTELLPLLKDRTLMLIIAGVSDETLRVNVIPQQRKSGNENDTAENAITSPLTITGTADELDREFAKQIAGFRGSLDRLKSNLGEIESAHAAALKTVEEERKKELNSKRKASSTSVKPEARNVPESAPAPANGKLVFGGKPQSAISPTPQSLFDSGSALSPAEKPVESVADNTSQHKSGAPIAAAELTTNTHPAAAISEQPNTDKEPEPAECGICHGPILPNQQRHSLMPSPAHASATDCEASRRSVTTAAR